MVIGHDYLIQMGGAERVVASMLRKWPGSPVYTSAAKWDTLLPEFRTAEVHTSWMQRLPGIERHFKKFFALYPAAFRGFGVIDAPVAWGQREHLFKVPALFSPHGQHPLLPQSDAIPLAGRGLCGS